MVMMVYKEKKKRRKNYGVLQWHDVHTKFNENMSVGSKPVTVTET
jgi:hypothetical protein